MLWPMFIDCMAMLLPIMFGILSPVRCCKLVVSGVVVTTVGMADVIAMW